MSALARLTEAAEALGLRVEAGADSLAITRGGTAPYPEVIVCVEGGRVISGGMDLPVELMTLLLEASR